MRDLGVYERSAIAFESGETQETWEERQNPKGYRQGIAMFNIMMSQVHEFNRHLARAHQARMVAEMLDEEGLWTTRQSST
jgi:hypothetical protein